MTTFEDILKIKKKIFAKAKGDIRDRLKEMDMYNSPATFWSAALNYGVCSRKEFELAKKYYQNAPSGNMWNYVGD